MTEINHTLVIASPQSKYLIGVEWDYADSKKAAKVKAASIKKTTKKSSFAVPNNDGSWLVGSAEDKTGAKHFAAPIVARLIGSGIIYHVVDENRAWLMACNEGSVIPFHDRIVQRIDAGEMIDQWLDEIQLDLGTIDFKKDDWGRVDEYFSKSLNRSTRKQFLVPQTLSIKKIGLISVAALTVAGLAMIVLPYLSQFKNQTVMPAIDEGAREAMQLHMAKQHQLRIEFENQAAQKKHDHLQLSAGGQIESLLRALDNTPSPYPFASIAAIECNSSEQADQWLCTPTWDISNDLGLLAKHHVDQSADIQKLISGEHELRGEPISLAIKPATVVGAKSTEALQGPWVLWVMDDLKASLPKSEHVANFEWSQERTVQHTSPSIQGVEPINIGYALELKLTSQIEQDILQIFDGWLVKHPSKLKKFSIKGSQMEITVDIHR